MATNRLNSAQSPHQFRNPYSGYDERVELSLQEARKIDQENGWITILTTVESDDTTVTFQESEQVA
jgi:hypothetical protein